MNMVLGFMIFEQHVTLLEKVKPEFMAGRWNGVGGRVEEARGCLGEAEIHAMVREFEEETGTATQPEHWTLTISLTHGGNVVNVFHGDGAAVDFWGIPWRARGKAERVRNWRRDALPDAIMPNLRWMIPLQLAEVKFPLYIEDVSSFGATEGGTW